ncbi:MAG: hypothetical protein NZ802_08065, partial [Candidatus Poseidoniales archaeon]|nr:hypothetical protein [Candidatus Poseidoniales archaeon]
CSRPSFNAQFGNSIDSQLLIVKKWPNDISNSLLDEYDLLGLRPRIHACKAISSKTLQSGRELPVRPATGSTGQMM